MTLMRMLAFAALTALPVSAAMAQDDEGAPDAGDAIEVQGLDQRRIATRTFSVEPGEAERALEGAADPTIALSERRLTRAGASEVVPPSRELLDTVAAPRPQGAPGAQRDLDPVFDPAAERTVFAPDDRVRIGDTTGYPFRAIGQIWGKLKDGSWYTCTGTMIDKRTVLTAAHCLYDHDTGDWAVDYEFYPGLNGSKAPFGKYGCDEVKILNGYVSNYRGSYGTVVPWDLGVIILDKNAGSKVGTLDISRYDPAFDFTGNIVGYPGDKAESTMWRASCDMESGRTDEQNMDYNCDTYSGTSGSSIYSYDKANKKRKVLGVNIASNSQYNVGIRLNALYYQWVAERRQ